MQSVGASKIYTGQEWLEDYVIVVEEGSVEDLLPKSKCSHIDAFYENCMIVPPFIDLQVYGAGGRLFSVFPEAGTLSLMRESFLESGTLYFLPTVATNSPEVFRRCIAAIREYWKEGGKGVLGLHLEGPWLNPLKRGAHLQDWMHAPTLEEVKSLCEEGKDVIRMITLAPEVCTPEIITYLKEHSIVLSAGHSNVEYMQAMQAFDLGIPAVTHLYNAMSPFQHRAPGLVGAAFQHPAVRASIIPDGIHVDYAAVAVAGKIMGDRLFAITDAVTETTEGPYRHVLNVDRYECNEALSGSALTMHKAFLNLVQHAGFAVEQALKMCSLFPAQLIGLEKRTGRITPGSEGAFLLLNGDLSVAETIIL